MSTERNAALTTVLQLYRRFQAGEISADKAFRTIIYGELSPAEKLVFRYLVENPESTSVEIAAALKMSRFHSATILKRFVDLGLAERDMVYEGQVHTYLYQLRD